MAHPSTRSFAFPRCHRLLLSRDFARVKGEGRRLAQGCVAANWLSRPGASVSRLGIITSRRIGGAVVRNRARRLLREVFRRHHHEMSKTFDLVLVARQSIVGKSYWDVESDVLKVLQRGRLLQAKA